MLHPLVRTMDQIVVMRTGFFNEHTGLRWLKATSSMLTGAVGSQEENWEDVVVPELQNHNRARGWTPLTGYELCLTRNN